MKRHLDRGAWPTLFTAAGLLLYGAVGMLIFFSLPTDGWVTVNPLRDQAGLIYTFNVAGAASGLQWGDRVTAIEGFSSNLDDLSALSSRWKAESILQYTLVREGTARTAAVTLGHWSLLPAVRYFVAASGETGGLLGNLIFLMIAGMAFFKRPADHAARTLFILAAMVVSLGPMVVIGISNVAAHIFPVYRTMRNLAIIAGFTILFPPFLLRLSLVFPHPKPVVVKHPFIENAPLFIGMVSGVAFLLTNGAAGYLWTVAAIVAAIAILIHSAFTMKDALSQAQLFWGLWGMIIGLLLFLSTYLVTFGIVNGVIADFVSTLSSLSFGVLGITLAIAILRYRLFEISFIIRRTLLYSALTAVLGLVYSFGVLIFQQIFRALTGQESSLAVVLSTLVIAALFTPLRRRLQVAVDQRFYRRKYDAEQAAATFAAAARSEMALNELTEQMVSVVQESVQPQQVWVWMKYMKGGLK